MSDRLSRDAVLLWQAVRSSTPSRIRPTSCEPWGVLCNGVRYPSGTLWELIDAGIATWDSWRQHYRLTERGLTCASCP